MDSELLFPVPGPDLDPDLTLTIYIHSNSLLFYNNFLWDTIIYNKNASYQVYFVTDPDTVLVVLGLLT